MKKNPTWQKTVSWLAVSYILIAATVWYESGNLSVALLAAFWACVIKTPIYSLHESLWGRVIFTPNVISVCEEMKEIAQEAAEAA